MPDNTGAGQDDKRKYEIGDTVNIEITTKNFGRIAKTACEKCHRSGDQRERESAIYDHFHMKEKDIVTGIVQRQVGDSVNVSLDDKTEALLKPSEMIEGERYERGDRIKALYHRGQEDKQRTKDHCIKNSSRARQETF